MARRDGERADAPCLAALGQIGSGQDALRARRGARAGWGRSRGRALSRHSRPHASAQGRQGRAQARRGQAFRDQAQHHHWPDPRHAAAAQHAPYVGRTARHYRRSRRRHGTQRLQCAAQEPGGTTSGHLLPAGQPSSGQAAPDHPLALPDLALPCTCRCRDSGASCAAGTRCQRRNPQRSGHCRCRFPRTCAGVCRTRPRAGGANPASDCRAGRSCIHPARRAGCCHRHQARPRSARSSARTGALDPRRGSRRSRPEPFALTDCRACRTRSPHGRDADLQLRPRAAGDGNRHLARQRGAV